MTLNVIKGDVPAMQAEVKERGTNGLTVKILNQEN